MSPSVPGLTGCAKDAELIYNALCRCGMVAPGNIKVRINENAHRRGILSDLQELASAPRINGVLVYFAGHGFSCHGSNYLVPWDGQFDASNAADTCFSLQEFTTACTATDDRPAIVMTDACRQGVLTIPSGIKPFFCSESHVNESNWNQPQVILSSPPGQASDFPAGLGHGLFTYHVAEALGHSASWSDGWVNLGQLYNQVASRMVARSSQQHFIINRPHSINGCPAGNGGVLTRLDNGANPDPSRITVSVPHPCGSRRNEQPGNGMAGELTLDLAPATALLIHCINLIESGNYQQTLDLIHGFPGWDQDKHLLTALGVALRMLKQYQKAKDYIARALSLDHSYSYANLSMGNVLLLEKQYNAAEYYYRQAIRFDEHYTQAHYGLGTLFAHQDKFTTALVHYLKALQTNPCWPLTRCGLGFIYHKLGRVDLAVTEYKEAIQLDPDFYYTHYGLGRALTALKDFTVAEESFRECLRLNPDMAAGFYELGELMRILGRRNEAVEMLERALELDMGYMPAHLGLASVYTDQNKVEQALSKLESALALDPSFARTHCLIAELNLALGRRFQAKRHAKLAASLAKSGDDVFRDSRRLLTELAREGE